MQLVKGPHRGDHPWAPRRLHWLHLTTTATDVLFDLDITLDATPSSTGFRLYNHHVHRLTKIAVGHILAEDDKIFLGVTHRLYFDVPLKKYLQKEPRNDLSHVRAFVHQNSTHHPTAAQYLSRPFLISL